MNIKNLAKEVKEHIPFTLTATILAIIIAIFVKIFLCKEIPEPVFHTLHPLHVIASAIVTAGIYSKYKKNILLAILIGISGSIIIGTISDVLFPYLGGMLLNLQTEFHLPIIEKPALILSASLIGCLIGISKKITKVPHFIHVFLSVFASLTYLITFSKTLTTTTLILSTITIFLAVIIPCCISDILYPNLFLKKKKRC